MELVSTVLICDAYLPTPCCVGERKTAGIGSVVMMTC